MSESHEKRIHDLELALQEESSKAKATRKQVKVWKSWTSLLILATVINTGVYIWIANQLLTDTHEQAVELIILKGMLRNQGLSVPEKD